MPDATQQQSQSTETIFEYHIEAINVEECGIVVIPGLPNVPTNMRSVSQGRICPDKFTCCHTETENADHAISSGHRMQALGR